MLHKTIKGTTEEETDEKRMTIVVFLDGSGGLQSGGG